MKNIRRRSWLLKKLNIGIAGLGLIGALVAQVVASEPPLGGPVNGLQASIVPTKERYRVEESIDVMVVLTNVSNRLITIDAWPGNWFVEVYDHKGNIITPRARVVDQLRAAVPALLNLQPGQRREQRIEGLRLIAHLPGSSPEWEYAPLKVGEYWLGATYEAPTYTKYPHVWSGRVECRLMKITVKESW